MCRGYFSLNLKDQLNIRLDIRLIVRFVFDLKIENSFTVNDFSALDDTLHQLFGILHHPEGVWR